MRGMHPETDVECPVAAGAMDHVGFEMTLLDYVPCYRTEAGTGNAMAFATWS